MVLTPLEKTISLNVLQDSKEALRDFKKSYRVPFISPSAFIQCLRNTLLTMFTGNTLLKIKKNPKYWFHKYTVDLFPHNSHLYSQRSILKICYMKIFLALYSDFCMENSVPLGTRMCSEKQVCKKDKEVRLENPNWQVNSLFLCSHWANKVLCKPGNALFTHSSFEIIIDFCPYWCLGGDSFSVLCGTVFPWCISCFPKKSLSASSVLWR